MIRIRFNSLFQILGAVLVTCAFSSSSFAQSTIFNIPSTDVVAKGKTYFEFDFFRHLESDKNGGFTTVVPRVVVGAGHGVEMGLNLAVTSSANPTTVYIQPNIKYQFFSNEKEGTALTAGVLAFIPAKDRKFNDTFTMLYMNGSKKFSGDLGPRVTAGAYGLISYDAATGPNSKKPSLAGAMLGFEQPLTKKVSLVADWFSGNNAVGYVTPGFSFTLPKNSLLNVGYTIGNFGHKNNALYIYYGITF